MLRRFTCLRLTLMAALLLCAATSARAQHTLPMATRSLEFNVSSLNGLPLHGAARGMQGLDYSAGASVGTVAGRTVLHRIFLDRSHRVYFGYDLIAIPSPGGHQVHLHFAQMIGLHGFNVDPSAFRHVTITLPADETVPIDSPVRVPLEIDAQGTPLLLDTLTFGPPPL